jgi:hypothetical protein
MTNDPSRFGWFPPNVVSVQTIDREQAPVATTGSPAVDSAASRSGWMTNIGIICCIYFTDSFCRLFRF